MKTVEHKQTVHRLVDSINRRNPNIVNELFDRNYVYHGIGEESQLSRDGFLNFLNKVFQAFPDFNLHVDELVADGDRIAYRMTISGTHRGEFRGMAATGKKFTTSTIGVMRFENGKIAEEWEIYDAMGMMAQLGALTT